MNRLTITAIARCLSDSQRSHKSVFRAIFLFSFCFLLSDFVYSQQNTYFTNMLYAKHYFEQKGFLSPDLQIELDVREHMVFLHNYGYIDEEKYKIVLDESTLDENNFIICHEIFHYIQAAYLEFDPAIKPWLTEPTATAMASMCSGSPIPLPCNRFQGDVFANEIIASFFWEFLLQRDSEVVKKFFESLKGKKPTKDWLREWLEIRYKKNFDEIVVEFNQWYVKFKNSHPFSKRAEVK